MAVTLAYLSRNIWARGEITEPKLVLVFSEPTRTSTTVEVYLADYNGFRVTDIYTTTVPAGTRAREIPLGDFINAQQGVKGFGSGLYMVVVRVVGTGEVFALPLVVTLGYITAPAVPDREHLQYFTVFDRVIGAYINLPPTIDYIPLDPRFMVYAYFHKGNKGRLIGFNLVGDIAFDTGYHQLALITLTISFSSLSDMVTYVLGHSYGLTHRAVQQVLDAISRGDYSTALALLRPFFMVTFLGRAIAVEFDVENYEIRVQTQVFLGQWDWSSILSWGALGCGVAVAVAIAATALTAGLAAVTLPLVAGACLAGGAIGVWIAVNSSASSDDPDSIKPHYDKLVDAGERAKKLNEQYYSDAKAILDRWLAEGKITESDYDEMKRALDTWKTGMDAAIDDIINIGVVAIRAAYDEGYRNGHKEGYKKGVEESKMWMAVAAVVGVILGLLLGGR